MDKLKEKIQKSVNEKYSKVGFKCLNSQANAQPGYRQNKPKPSTEQELYHTIMAKLEDREKTLILENQALKSTLEEVCRQCQNVGYFLLMTLGIHSFPFTF